MRVLEPSRRILVLLLGCLVTALVFPGACSAARVRVGALLPATADLSRSPPQRGAGADERVARLEEHVARLSQEAVDLRRRLGALPAGDRPPLDRLVVPTIAAPGSEQRAVAARVLHRDVSRSRCSFLIDVGSAAGVRRGLAVVHGDSLVGIVDVVTPNASRVRRLDDPRWESYLTAVVVGEGDSGEATLRGEGVARGNGSGGVEVSYLGEAGAQVGDFALTGVGRFPIPEGLVLGRVETYEDDDRDGAWVAHVAPLRPLDDVRAVFVIVTADLQGGQLGSEPR